MINDHEFADSWRCDNCEAIVKAGGLHGANDCLFNLRTTRDAYKSTAYRVTESGLKAIQSSERQVKALRRVYETSRAYLENDCDILNLMKLRIEVKRLIDMERTGHYE